MSKSGLFAHFGSKEELQLATIDAARRRFVEHVVKQFQLMQDPIVFDRAATAIRARLDGASLSG